jgi:tubulin monoglycylase TTLL3/8
VKPASRSRGRGIKAFSDLDEILDYVIGREDIQWVAQKYIENPLIVKNRKFDIRQWVVLSDLKPLRIWIYYECYIRFSAE